MQSVDLNELRRKRPFEPIELGLSDGRSVVVRHPDQMVVAKRHVILGLAQIKQGRKRLSTPTNGDTIAKDWMLLDVVHIVSAEPENGEPSKRRGKKRST